MSTDTVLPQEISQSTYVELIYTEVRTGKTFPPSTATVLNSVNRLAFGKPGPYRDVVPQTPPQLVPIPPHQVTRKYSIGSSAAVPQDFKSQRIAAEFNALMRNSAPEVGIQGFVAKFSVDCLSLPWPPTKYGSFSLDPAPRAPTYYSGINAIYIPEDTYLIWDASEVPGLAALENGSYLTASLDVSALIADGVLAGQNARVAIQVDRNGAGPVVGMANAQIYDLIPNTTNIRQSNLPAAAINYSTMQPVLQIDDSYGTRVFTIGGGAGRPPLLIRNVTLCPVPPTTPPVSPPTTPPVSPPPAPPPPVSPPPVSPPPVTPPSSSSCDWLVNGDFASGPIGSSDGGTGPGLEMDPRPLPGWTWDPSSYGKWYSAGNFTVKVGLIYQTITGLPPGKKLRITADVSWPTEAGRAHMEVWQGVLDVNQPGRVIKFGDTIGSIFTPGNIGQRQTIVFDTTTPVGYYGVAYLALYGSVLGQGVDRNSASVQYHSVVVCLLDEDPVLSCTSPATNVRTLIQHNGIPRKPVNIFNLIMRLTYRDANNPLTKTVRNVFAQTDGRLGTVTPTNCSTGDTCDRWKQQGVSNVAQPSITTQGMDYITAPAITAGLQTNVTNKHNWLWSIPANSTGSAQDAMISLWLDSDSGILESIEVLMLAQVVSLTGTTNPLCAGPFVRSPDPATSADIVLRYTNGLGKSREFRQTFNLSDLYQTSMPSSAWDTQSAIDNGIKGTTARWESYKFILDAVDGSGLDQCTDPVAFTADGKGLFTFTKFATGGSGVPASACGAYANVTEINKGSAINEVQSIILPGPTGGAWKLTFYYANQSATTSDIPWDATAAQVRASLAALPLIGHNVEVTGSGTDTSPFLVEFTGLLAGRDYQLLQTDGSTLIGATPAFVIKVSTGSTNERQVISKAAGVISDLIINFGGVQSTPIAYNSSLNSFQSALEGMSSIGVGNVSVSGLTTDRDVDYTGPWSIDFIGTFASQNVETITASSTSYLVTTSWQGGAGVNDVQKVIVTASSGGFALNLSYPPSGTTVPPPAAVTTASIPVTATAAVVKSAILAAANWLTPTDLAVARLPPVSGFPDLTQWRVVFGGQWATKPVPLMTIQNSTLQGSAVVVSEVTKGAGSSERQQLDLIKANGGSYRLTFTVSGQTITTAAIPWNADADGILLALQALPIFPMLTDISVKETAIHGSDIVASFLIIFGQRFGDVPLIETVNNLQCDPLILDMVPPPPYEYKIGDCDDLQGPSCSPGPLLCRPGEGDPEEELEVCCDQLTIRDSANRYREIMLQRDLFDPSRLTASARALTVRDLAVVKGLRPSEYNAYARDFYLGTLQPVDMTTPVTTQMSILLIGTDIDTKVTRDRLGRTLMRRPNVLPSRMAWSNPALKGS